VNGEDKSVIRTINGWFQREFAKQGNTSFGRHQTVNDLRKASKSTAIKKPPKQPVKKRFDDF
jgi:hypothetical protein